MKLNTSLPKKLVPHYKSELANYHEKLKTKNLQGAWHHLERAHIIGQSYPLQHTYVHFKMLQFGVMIKSPKEVLGQIPRLLVGGIKSFVGKVPLGNPGGSNVPPMKSFPIPEDIQQMFTHE